MQTPIRQTVPEVPGQQSTSEVHPVRQTAFTHIQPAAQSALDRHCGCGRWSGRQVPATQASAAPQSASAWQLRWQTPLIQDPPEGQSLL
jgi:hypothetical protein